MTTRKLTPDELAQRARQVEWLLLDVDGVLTDGGLYYDQRGRVSLRFDVRDGLGIKLAQQAGLKIGALTGRRSRALERRARELGFDEVITGSHDKLADLDGFLDRRETEASRVAFVGDDLPDLVVLGRCGLSFAPADAVSAVRAVVDVVLETPGGRGAAREAIEILLAARGEWDSLVAGFSFDGS